MSYLLPIQWSYTYGLIFVISVLYFVLNAIRKKKYNYPPGPKGLPFIGYLPFIKAHQDLVVEQISKQHEDSHLIMFPVGCENIVLLNSLEAIREAFVKQGEKFAYKGKKVKGLDYGMDYKGVFSEDGPLWKEQRKFTINTLREFGVVKSTMEDKILLECDAMVEQIRKFEGKPFQPVQFFEKTVTNVLCNFINGERYAYEDPKLLYLAGLLERTDIAISSTYAVDYYHWLKYLPVQLNGLQHLESIKAEIYKYMEEKIAEHDKTFDEHRIRDFTDAFLVELKRREALGYKDHAFEYERLRSNMVALFVAGTVTTAMTLGWATKLLMKNPQLQEKLEKEIDQNIGKDRLPSWTDRNNFPFIEATILEVQRFTDLLPVGIPRSNNVETNVLGYDIPKRCLVYGNFKKMHNDPKLWGDPQNFRPEHFIDSKTGKVINKELMLSFGLGNRACIGEPLARMNLFHVLVALVKNFTFHHATPKDEEINVIPGLARYLPPFQVIARPRI